MSWYYVDITEDNVQDGDFHRLCRKFQQSFIAAGAPPEMALFAQRPLQDNVRKVYFSPGSVRYVKPLIDAYKGRACDGPERARVTLVFGVPDAGRELVRDVVQGESEEAASDRPAVYPVSEEREPVRVSRPVAVAT